MTTVLKWLKKRSTLGGLLIFASLAGLVVLGRYYCLNAGELAGWVQAVGSIAATLIAIWVMHWQQAKTLERDTATERSQSINLLKAIRSEIELFTPLILSRLRAEGAIWRNREISFPIYHASAGQIGLLKNDQLRHKIIQVYHRIQDFFVTAENYSFEGGKVMLQVPPIPEDQQLVADLWDQVVGHGREVLPGLKALDAMLADAIGRLEAGARKD